ncbi:MAG: hypothetical protein ACE141_18730 [Bryobacteraceae bacterium]
MNMKVRIAGALIVCAALHAQTQQPSAPKPKPEPEEQVAKEDVYVRRFSGAITLSVLGLPLVPKNDISVQTTSPTVDALYSTGSKLRRVGYGGSVQVAVTERFAVSGGGFMRWISYGMTSDILEGTDNPNTIEDERKSTIKNEDTRARLYDFPVTIRYYGKDRHDPGPRFFVEGGGVLRRVARIRTSIDTTINAGDKVCCNTTPITPHRRDVRGVVAGFGVQVTDPIGIRVVPQFRYTHWMGDIFNSYSTVTRRHQIEAMISLGF